MFAPTLDWGHELLVSLKWIGQAWLIAAVATLVICVLIAKYTVWGRQFWRITGDYFKGPESVKVWLWLAVILLSVISGVRLSVLFTFQGSDMMTSFQVVASGVAAGDDAIKNSGRDGFYMSMVVFSALAVLHVVRIMFDLFVTQRFMLAWRAWLTDRLTGDWLEGKAYYRGRFIDDTIDNPDQRIQYDIDIFTAGVGGLPNTPGNTSTSTLLFGSVDAIASMISFTAILWSLSGTLTLPIVNYELPKAMFWILLTYVLFASVIAFWVGRPIIWLSFRNEKFNAAFRYALVRLRDASEAVAFYRGEIAERDRAAQALRAHRRQLQAVDQPDDGLLRLEPVDEPDHRRATVSVPVPAVLQRRNHARRDESVGFGVRQHRTGAVLLPERLRRVRRLSRLDHPPRWAGDRERRRHGRCPRSRPRRARTARCNSRRSRFARPTGNSSSTRSTCDWKSGTHWW